MTVERTDSTCAYVCGMQAEAACVPQDATPWPVFCAGGSAGRAYEGTMALIEQGATHIVSFGIAGGLIPHLASGLVCTFGAVVTRDGQRFAADPRRFPRLLDAGDLLGSNTALLTPEEKKRAHRQTRAVAVDMERHGVARAAAECDVPLTLLRAIADEASHRIPAYAMKGLAEDGTTRAWPVIGGLVRQPWTLPQLLRLAAGSRRALRRLQSVWQAESVGKTPN